MGGLMGELHHGDRKELPDLQVKSLDYRGPTVSSRKQDLRHIIATIGGHPLKVWYYHSLLGKDSEQLPLSRERLPEWQQYRLIKDLELRLDAPLSFSIDNQTRDGDMSATATLFPGIVPHNGDMIRFDLGDGREALFAVRHNEKKSIFNDAVYKIDFSIYGFTDDLGTKEDLDSKVQGEPLYFIKEMYYSNQSPLIVEGEYFAYEKLRNSISDMISRYGRRAVDREYKTILIPTMADTTYDHFLASFVKKIMLITAESQLVDFNLLDVTDDQAMRSLTIFDLLLQRRKDVLSNVCSIMGLASSGDFDEYPIYGGVAYSGVLSVIYPTNGLFYDESPEATKRTKVARYSDTMRKEDAIKQITSSERYKGHLIDGQDLIPEISFNEGYVFNEGFYKEGKITSLLEHLVMNHISGRVNNSQQLLCLYETIPYWSRLEFTYFVPILTMLFYQRLLEY